MSFTTTDLQQLMAMLRDRQHGCPWDQKQTHATIAPYTIEEAYEVMDAVLQQDPQHLCEELGDLLFQVVFQAQIAAENGDFTFDDVVRVLMEKMLRRHPHVFPDGTLSSFGQAAEITEEQISENWQRIKAAEKASKPQHLLDAVPTGMGPLEQAVKIQKTAAKVGFDWSEVAPVFAKIREELNELEQAYQHLSQDEVEAELGDVLFAVANLARHSQVSPDVALGRTNRKFRHRFAYIEQVLSGRGVALTDCSLEQLDELWDEAKRQGL